MKKTIRFSSFIIYLFGCLAYANNLTVEKIEHQTSNQQTKQTNYQNINSIHKLVTSHVKQKIDQKIYEPTIKLRKLSSRLKLPHCSEPLQMNDRSPNSYAGRMTISVSCQNPKWRVFVPATVNGKQFAVISTKGILKRAVIKKDDLKQVLVPYKNIPAGSMNDLTKAIGMRTKKAIAPNQIIKIRDLQPPFWVFKNQQINLITRIGSIEVKTIGVALANGVVNEQVPVKNSSSDKVVKGIVIAPNAVLVP
jgi:flagella basal body P-ring formation protein FlgA